MSKRTRRSRSKRKDSLPKGAYRLPTGGCVTDFVAPPMRGRRIRVVAVHRDEPDADKVARALIAIVLDEHQRNQD
jgi:hypothetical protein